MKVSIIVPIYNACLYLSKCLESLVNQTYENIEIILINDGSTDQSEDIVKLYLEKFDNIIYIKDTNHGQGHARNLGIERATGELITFVDSDDYVDETMIEKLLNNMGDSDVSICDITKIDSTKQIYFKNHINYGSDQINFMLSHPGPVAKLYKKELLKDHRFMENVYYEDLAFTTTLAPKVHKVSYLEEQLYFYIIHDNSTMQQKVWTDKLDDVFKVMDYVTENLKDYKEELEYLYIEHYLYSCSLRFIDYPEGKERLEKVEKLMETYPEWSKNKYYQQKSKKSKIICMLASKKMYGVIKLLKKLGGKK